MRRRVVISGGSSGIGRACAAWFADHGDEVWIVGRDQRRLDAVSNDLDGAASTVSADVSTVEGAERVVDAIGDGVVDVIVAAAGGARAREVTDLAEVASDWESDLRQNVMSTVLFVHALRPLLARPGGRIIGLGSIGGQIGSGYGGSYGASKAALHAWAFSLAAELGPEGITANLVLPGFVPDTAFFGDRVTDEFTALRVEKSLVKRAGTSREVAEAVGFLASESAGYITGQLFGVNGGMVLGR